MNLLLTKEKDITVYLNKTLLSERTYVCLIYDSFYISLTYRISTDVVSGSKFIDGFFKITVDWRRF